ncbi:MAG: hypothetical protein QOF94_2502, partial [Acidobacteriaceae bacterium]
CLEKDRNQRFQSAKDLTFALSVSGSGITKMQTEAAFHRSGHQNVWGLAIALLAVLVVIADCAATAGLLR